MRATPDGDRGGADPRRRARGGRLPAGAAGRGRGPAPADRAPRRRRACGWCRPAIRPGSARAASRECLALQLRERDRLDPAMQALLDQPRRWRRAASSAELRALCGVDAEDLADMLAELRALDPKPGLRFARGAGRGGGARRPRAPRAPTAAWTVELNTETLPRVLVNNVYAALGRRRRARRAPSSRSAAPAPSWLVRSLEQRARTILKVATRDRRSGRSGSSRSGVGRAAAADPARGRRPARAARIDRQPSGGRQVPRPAIRAASSSASSSARRSRRVAGGEAFSAAAVQERIRGLIDGGAARRAAVGRQDRRGAQRRGD